LGRGVATRARGRRRCGPYPGGNRTEVSTRSSVVTLARARPRPVCRITPRQARCRATGGSVLRRSSFRRLALANCSTAPRAGTGRASFMCSARSAGSGSRGVRPECGCGAAARCSSRVRSGRVLPGHSPAGCVAPRRRGLGSEPWRRERRGGVRRRPGRRRTTGRGGPPGAAWRPRRAPRRVAGASRGRLGLQHRRLDAPPACHLPLSRGSRWAHGQRQPACRPVDAAARHLTAGVFCPECWQREFGSSG